MAVSPARRWRWRNGAEVPRFRRAELRDTTGDSIPGPFSIQTGAVPGLARGLGHTAPTYVVGVPGSKLHRSRRLRKSAVPVPLQLIRWFLTFILVFVAALLAMLLLALLLIAFGVLKMAGMIRWIRPEQPPAQPDPVRPQRVRPRPASQPAAARIDRDLPEAPPQTELHRLRSWDAEQNRAVDRWYYKDGTGQWVFVRPPGTA